MIPIERTGDFLVSCRIRQQITCQLPDRELVETKVLVEGSDDPVPPDPLPRVAILLKPVAVGIAGGIEPGQRHSLAIVGAGHQPIDNGFVSLFTGVIDEVINFLGGRRKSRQIDRQSFDECRPVRFGGRSQPFRLQFGQNKSIDWRLDPFGFSNGGLGRSGRCDKGPVRLIDRPFRNPSFEQLFLFSGKFLVGLRRGHHRVRVVGFDPRDQ